MIVGQYVRWERVRFRDVPESEADGPAVRGVGTVMKVDVGESDGRVYYHVAHRHYDDGAYDAGAEVYEDADLSPVEGPPEGSTR